MLPPLYDIVHFQTLVFDGCDGLTVAPKVVVAEVLADAVVPVSPDTRTHEYPVAVAPDIAAVTELVCTNPVVARVPYAVDGDAEALIDAVCAPAN